MYALITGAARGIGKAIAVELAALHYDVILVDFDEYKLSNTAAELQDVYGTTAVAIHQDLSEVDCHTNIFEKTLPYHDKLHIVVNNAGYGLSGAFDKLSLDEQVNMIQVNLLAMVKLTSVFIPVLKGNENTYLVNVGSTTAYQSIPYLAVYAASKAFVLSFTRSLQYELKSSNVSVSCVCPGSTDTDFVNRAGMNDRVKKMAQAVNMTAEQVAKQTVKNMLERKVEIIPGFLNKLNSLVPRMIPKRIIESIAANIYRA